MRWWYPEDGNRKNLKYSSAEDWRKKTADVEAGEPEYVPQDLDWEYGVENEEEESECDSNQYFWRRIITLTVLVGVLAAAGVCWVLLKRGESDQLKLAGVESEEKAEYIGAEEVIRRFMLQRNPQKRLQYVLHPEEVREHMADYPRQVLSERAYKVRKIGERVFEGRGMVTYSVGFRDKSHRLLNVLDTDEGPKIDWDSYARYGSASWDDFLDGEVTEAEVRVVVMPGDYYNPPFNDRAKWTSFRFSSPDLNQDYYLYAEKGSLREGGMRTMLAAASEYRLHMVLVLKRHEGVNGEKLMTCEKVKAIGWVKGSMDEEDSWAQQLGE